MIRSGYVSRSVFLIIGSILTICALVDGRIDWFAHLEAHWLLAAGTVLIAFASKRYSPKAVISS
jgi:hypothetical protein